MDGRNSPFRIPRNAVCTHPQSALTNLETTEWKMGTGESVKQRIQYSKCEIGWTRVKIDNVERDRWRIIMKERESDRREKKNTERQKPRKCLHTPLVLNNWITHCGRAKEESIYQKNTLPSTGSKFDAVRAIGLTFGLPCSSACQIKHSSTHLICHWKYNGVLRSGRITGLKKGFTGQ